MKKYENIARELMMVERAGWWNPRVQRILKAAPLVVMFLLLNTRAARACSFNPTPDTADGSANSLRHAIQMANASSEDCLIQLQAGTYTLTIANTNGQENMAAQGDLDITATGHTVTILGKGAGVSIVNGNGIDRVFQLLGGANAVFRKQADDQRRSRTRRWDRRRAAWHHRIGGRRATGAGPRSRHFVPGLARGKSSSGWQRSERSFRNIGDTWARSPG
jgi:hypothetical protein